VLLGVLTGLGLGCQKVSWIREDITKVHQLDITENGLCLTLKSARARLQLGIAGGKYGLSGSSNLFRSGILVSHVRQLIGAISDAIKGLGAARDPCTRCEEQRAESSAHSQLFSTIFFAHSSLAKPIATLYTLTSLFTAFYKQ
jgi:hypothetical protein